MQVYIKLKVHILNEVIVYKVHPLVQNCGIKYKLHSCRMHSPTSENMSAIMLAFIFKSKGASL